MRTESSVVSSDPMMNARAPNFFADGFQSPLKKNSVRLTSLSVMRPCLPTKKMIEKMISVIRQAEAMKRYLPHLS